MAATRMVGQMYEFQPEKETVTAYIERFQLFASAKTIAKDIMNIWPSPASHVKW